MAQIISDATMRNSHFPPEEVILGTSSAMEEVRRSLERVACTNVPILIRGEAGSGKEILARLIHRRYPGETGLFHKVAPGDQNQWRKSASVVLPEEVSKAEDRHLQSMPAKHACLGSLFFEEVAELNAALQRRLVRLLRDDRTSGMDVGDYTPGVFRVICSTKHDIEQEMKKGSFREDLFYSINIVTLCVPPLRDRREDIPALAHYLWQRCREEFISDIQPPSAQLIKVFQKYDWPGNIRELDNMVKRYVLFGSEEKIILELTTRTHQPPAQELPSGTGISLKRLAKQETQKLERNIILETLRATKWNRKQTARALKISYRTLLYKMKEAGVPPKRIAAKREK